MNTSQRIRDLSNVSTSLGLLMKSGQNSYSPIKLALQPVVMKKVQYTQIGQISKIWQKLLYLASKDVQLIKQTFQQVSHVDDLIKNIYKIFLKTCSIPRNSSLLITRVDYFKNTKEEFKIIQYNVTATSMHSHSQNFSKAQQIVHLQQERNLQNLFPDNAPCTQMVDSIAELYKAVNLKGIFLMVVSLKQKNVVDQINIQLKLLEKGIKSRRQTLCSLKKNIKINQNKLFYDNQQVSVVYSRAGYQARDYCQNGKPQQCWQARQLIQLSDAIKIPDIKMQLMNQKRMQVQLSKVNVHQKYLTQEQCAILRKSLVFTIDFQQNPSNIDYIKFMEQKGVDKFILKPNLQGGGNNVYGKKAYELLKTLTQQQRKKFIMMQKIQTTPVENTMFLGNQYQKINCICEISRYGIVMQVNGKLVKNDSDGYLVRIKPQYSDEGGVMAGVGGIAVISFDK